MKMEKNRGEFAEDYACEYLIEKGYEIIDRNYSERIGELDIVCTYENYLVIVEVKARTDDKFGAPSDFVTLGKQDRIRKTTETHIDKNDLYDYQPRFDVIEIYLDNFKLNHYIDAF